MTMQKTLSGYAARLQQNVPLTGRAIATLLMGFSLVLSATVAPRLAAADSTNASPAKGGIVYTADENGNSISAINLATRQVTTIPIEISPHNVQVSLDGKRLFAVGSPPAQMEMSGSSTGHDEMGGGELLVFDTTNLLAGPMSVIALGEHPAHVVVDGNGQYAFVSLSGENAVAAVDLQEKKVSRLIPTGAFPHGLRISPDGHEIYVANVKDGSVSVLDTAKLVELKRIEVGTTPVQVGFVPDGKKVYVSLRDANSVAIVDTKSRAVTATVKVGRSPIQVHSTTDGRSIFVANQGTEDSPDDTVSVIDTQSDKVVATIRTGKGAHGVTVSSDGAYAYVSNIVDGTVSEIATDNLSVVDTINVGKGPNGITFQNAN